jgi:hypothetical protein
MHFLRHLKHLACIVLVGLTSCANYEVLSISKNPTLGIPQQSLSFAWRNAEVKIYVVKQGRLSTGGPGSITSKENDAIGTIAARSAQKIMQGLVPLLQTILQPYPRQDNIVSEAKYILNLEVSRVEIDVEGPRVAVISVNLTPKANPDRKIWQLAINVYASKSTTDEELLSDCAKAIKKEMQSSGLIEAAPTVESASPTTGESPLPPQPSRPAAPSSHAGVASDGPTAPVPSVNNVSSALQQPSVNHPKSNAINAQAAAPNHLIATTNAPAPKVADVSPAAPEKFAGAKTNGPLVTYSGKDTTRREYGFFMPLPHWEVIKLNERTENTSLSEMRPPNEARGEWTKTARFEQTFKQKYDYPLRHVELALAPLRKDCKQFTEKKVFDGDERGYPTVAFNTYCNETADGKHSEMHFIKAVQGADSFYSWHAIWRGEAGAMPSQVETIKKVIAELNGWLKSQFVCDFRVEAGAKACPPGLPTNF